MNTRPSIEKVHEFRNTEACGPHFTPNYSDREDFLQQGWSYLKSSRFVHHCTDGRECSLAGADTKRQAGQFFVLFHNIELKVAQFPIRKYWRSLPFALEKFLTRRLGWYLFIYGRK